MKGIDISEIEGYLKMTGERAMIDAKVHKTYIIYIDDNNQMIKEHYDGKIEIVDNY